MLTDLTSFGVILLEGYFCLFFVVSGVFLAFGGFWLLMAFGFCFFVGLWWLLLAKQASKEGRKEGKKAARKTEGKKAGRKEAVSRVLLQVASLQSCAACGGQRRKEQGKGKKKRKNEKEKGKGKANRINGKQPKNHKTFSKRNEKNKNKSATNPFGGLEDKHTCCFVVYSQTRSSARSPASLRLRPYACFCVC